MADRLAKENAELKARIEELLRNLRMLQREADEADRLRGLMA